MDDFESTILELDDLIANLLMCEDGTEEHKEIKNKIKLIEDELVAQGVTTPKIP